jgi:hypothetical protein
MRKAAIMLIKQQMATICAHLMMGVGMMVVLLLVGCLG